ncbi:MAG TPA: biopolymer transporter ExbD [Verrucomicrobiae bacterium]|jgi:biopolymer transport protein ExbD|nr:biopolymer transporter ExbD [Verrucomicrobiae bacterium]
MRFFVRKKNSPPAVIIVAMIDVLIVVLIFLMVTTTFKKPQNSLRLALPESSHAAKPGATDSPPLVIVIEENGGLRFGPEARPITVDALKSELQAEAAKNPSLKVELKADKKAPWGQVVRVMDAAKGANIKSLDADTKSAAAQ